MRPLRLYRTAFRHGRSWRPGLHQCAPVMFRWGVLESHVSSAGIHSAMKFSQVVKILDKSLKMCLLRFVSLFSKIVLFQNFFELSHYNNKTQLGNKILCGHLTNLTSKLSSCQCMHTFYFPQSLNKLFPNNILCCNAMPQSTCQKHST